MPERPVSDRSHGLEPWARQLLRCPVEGHPLVDAYDDSGAPVLRCAQECGGEGMVRQYPVRAGVPVLLTDDAQVVPA